MNDGFFTGIIYQNKRIRNRIQAEAGNAPYNRYEYAFVPHAEEQDIALPAENYHMISRRKNRKWLPAGISEPASWVNAPMARACFMNPEKVEKKSHDYTGVIVKKIDTGNTDRGNKTPGSIVLPAEHEPEARRIPT